MAHAALQALGILLDPGRLALLLVGMVAGMLVGMLPGLGGITAVSILLPFIYRMDPFASLAMLIGALGVVYTGDTITSVLMGTPGSPASAPTAIEGFALARQGQAARALSAAFLSSLLGGLIGTLVLTLSIPVAGPLVLALGTPELFMFTLLGLYYAGSLLGRDPLKGVLSGLLGLLLGTLGPAPAAAEYRFTFGQPYLMGGLSLEVVALGFFGVPEAVGMLARGGAIARRVGLGGGWLEGARDVLRHWGLVVRGSLIGTVAGLLPAVGANAATWMAYGHAVQVSRDRSRFGRGEIRGIIAPESANNCTVAADLVPTLLFSVPGGPAAAVLLGALFAHGYYPGPRFVQDNLDLMFVIVWSFAVASVAGAALCFLVSPALARVTQVPIALIAPPLLVVMTLGAFQSTQHVGDLVTLFVMALAGWAMKRAGWPRAPLLIGFVLADPMERHFWLTVKLHGWRWLAFPGVLAIAALMVAPLAVRLVQNLWKRRRLLAPVTVSAAAGAGAAAARVPAASAPAPAGQAEGRRTAGGRRRVHRVSAVLATVVLALFVLTLWQSTQLLPDSRLLPLLVTGLGVAAGVGQTVLEWSGRAGRASAGQEGKEPEKPERPGEDGAGAGGDDDDEAGEGGAPAPAALVRRELMWFGVVGAYLALVWAVGLPLASAALALVVLLREGRLSPGRASAYVAAVVLMVWVVAHFMQLKLPVPALWRAG